MASQFPQTPLHSLLHFPLVSHVTKRLVITAPSIAGPIVSPISRKKEVAADAWPMRERGSAFWTMVEKSAIETPTPSPSAKAVPMGARWAQDVGERRRVFWRDGRRCAEMC